MKNTDPRRKRLLIAVVASCWAGVAIVAWLRMPRPLTEEAKKVFDAVEAADGTRLLAVAFPEEIARNKLTPEKLHVLFRDIVNPRLRAAHQRSKPRTRDNGEQAIHGYSWKSASGHEYEYSADVYATSKGARTPVLRRVLDAWCTSYFAKYPGRFTPEARIDAILAGYREDAPRLKALGIVSLSEVDPAAGKVTLIELDGLEARYEAWKRKLAADAR